MASLGNSNMAPKSLPLSNKARKAVYGCALFQKRLGHGGDIEPGVIDRLLENACLISPPVIEEGATILDASTDIDEMGVIVDGCAAAVRSVTRHYEEMWIFLYSLPAGEVYGVTRLLDRGSHYGHIVAITPCRVIRFSAKAVGKAIRDHYPNDPKAQLACESHFFLNAAACLADKFRKRGERLESLLLHEHWARFIDALFDIEQAYQVYNDANPNDPLVPRVELRLLEALVGRSRKNIDTDMETIKKMTGNDRLPICRKDGEFLDIMLSTAGRAILRKVRAQASFPPPARHRDLP